MYHRLLYAGLIPLAWEETLVHLHRTGNLL